jgi:hypothetical protein
MRMQNLNKKTVWVVSVIGYTDKLDGDGFKTGERELQYSTPNKIKLALYPSNGLIATNEKGLVTEYDMTTVTTIELNESDLIFLSEPTTDFGKTYDYSVERKLDSLSHNRYGLMRRR